MNEDNQRKSISGKNAKQLIAGILDSLIRDFGIGMDIASNYSIGYPNKQKQFKMDFMISFHGANEERWLLKSTNSIRDRIYGTEFFAQNIRMINKNVTCIFVVVPDSISDAEKRNLKNYSDKIKRDDYTSFITDVITAGELRNMIVAKFSKNIPQGIKSNLLGADAEKEIVKLLNDNVNRNLWNDYEANRHTAKSSTFHIYKAILAAAGLDYGKDRIDKIEATDKIPPLPNKGHPKTDVSFRATAGPSVFAKNISVKNSSAKTVSVHEGSVEDLFEVLNLPKDGRLAQALAKFQELGSEKYLYENFPEHKNALDAELRQYNHELVGFFIFGTGSPLVVDAMQIADLLLYTKNFAVWGREQYIAAYIAEHSGKGQFGTPFQWTYPSGKRGQKIQIKGFTNN